MNTIKNQELTLAGLNAIEFCLEVGTQPEYKDLYLQVPDVFINQARSGLKSFEVPGHLVAQDLLRITVLDPIALSDDSLSFKLSLDAVLDMHTGDLMPMCKPNQMPEGCQYLKGFNSTRVSVSRGEVFTDHQFNILMRYADWVASQKAAGKSLWHNGNATRRVYIQPGQKDFKFQFTLDVRLNPSTYELVIGLSSDISIKAPMLLSTFPDQSAVGSIGQAKTQRSGRALQELGSAVPKPTRR